MKKEQAKTGIIFIFGIVIFLLVYGLGSQAQNYSQENNLLKTIIKADRDFSKISIDSQKAEQYYEEASYAYENENYNLVESNCRLARGYYSEESQGYKRIKAELKAVENEDKLIYIYVDVLDAIIEVTNNMYEACEYFESAARYYNMGNYDMGGIEIEGMNEKIIAHDNAIERYNNLLEDFRVEIEKRI